MAEIEKVVKKNPRRRVSSVITTPVLTRKSSLSWEYDYLDKLRAATTDLDEAERLFALSKWLLSSAGIQEMENRNVSADTVALLLERAAALVSFHPRYLNIHLIGTKPGIGDLPMMDRNGKADCYVKFSIRNTDSSENEEQESSNPLLHGESLQQETTSSIRYKTLSPLWNEKLELYIKGGSIEADGNYRDVETKEKLLVAEAWDADIGVWGRALDVSRTFFFLFIGGLFVGHVAGSLDRFLASGTTAKRAQLELGILLTLAINLISLAVCYMKAVVLRVDDEFIGSCEVPLEMLLDQRDHALCLNLKKSKRSKALGILRVKLSLSE
ncbi:MAG: hypothetical protein SGARI_002513 [Bacillariaceae sp.]